jgi:hypothetical protein
MIKMSKLDDLSKKANELADGQLKGLPKQLDKVMLSNRQMAKKIISFKSPNMSDSDLNLIVYGKDLQEELGPDYKPFVSDNENINPDIISTDPKSYFKPLAEDSPIFDEVKKIKTEVKDGIFILEQKSIDLGKESVKLGVLIGSTVPAAAILVAPVSFNIPGALTLVLGLINSINSINYKLLEFTPALRVIDKLKYVLPDDKVETISTPINALVSTISALSTTISALKLPDFSEAKETALNEGNKKMNKLKNQIDTMKVTDVEFATAEDPQAAFDDKKKKLEDEKVKLSEEIKKLL